MSYHYSGVSSSLASGDHRLRTIRIVAFATAIVLALAGCSSGSSGSGADKGDYEVLMVTGLTGLLSPAATAIKRGAQARVDDINAAGGINGRKIKLTSKDNQSDPTRGVTLIQSAINSSNPPDVVIPGVSSDESLAAAPILSRNKVVGIGIASNPVLDDPAKFPYFFSASVPQSAPLGGMAAFVAQHPGTKKVALVAPNSALGEGLQDFFAAAFTKLGIATKVFLFPSDEVDFTSTFQKAKASSPDWIIMDAPGSQLGALLQARIKASAEDIPTLAGVTASAAPILDISKDSERKNFYVSLLPTQAYIKPADRGEEFNSFFQRVNAQGKLTGPLSLYAVGWDMVDIWKRGVENVKGDVTQEKLKSSLEHLPPSKDPQFPLYQIGGEYTTKSHFHPGDPKSFTFGRLVSVKDGMSVVETNDAQ